MWTECKPLPAVSLRRHLLQDVLHRVERLALPAWHHRRAVARALRVRVYGLELRVYGKAQRPADLVGQIEPKPRGLTSAELPHITWMI